MAPPWIFNRIFTGSNAARLTPRPTSPRCLMPLISLRRPDGAARRPKLSRSDKAVAPLCILKKVWRAGGLNGSIFIKGPGLARWMGRADAVAAPRPPSNAWVGAAIHAPRSNDRFCIADTIVAGLGDLPVMDRLPSRRRSGWAMSRTARREPGARGPFAVCRRPGRSTGRRRGL